MSEGRYLKDRAGFYLVFFGVIVLLSAVILVLPYGTVYVQERMYLFFFLATVVICVAVFLFGMLFNALLWMQGKGLTGAPEKRLVKVFFRAMRFLLDKRLAKAVSVLAKDVLHMRRLKERSMFRWVVHFLIFGGFVLTFVLDLIVTFSLDLINYGPMISEDGWAKMWMRDFAFDLFGFMMLLGLVIYSIRRFIWRPKIVRTELPDAVSILFLLFVVLGGFILEGIGIAGSIPGHTLNQEYSFVGYAFSIMTPSSWGQYYDQVWLVHGVMSALLIAYIPFSKLFHMFATPIAIQVERMLPSGVRP